MHTRSLVSSLWPAACILVCQSSAQEPPSWQQYVRAPDSAIVRPATILSSYTQGNIANADGLVTGAATTVLTAASGGSDETPTLVVDFGQNVVGQLLLEFVGSTNGSSQAFPGIRLAFSEALEFLTDRSDYTRSDRAQGV